MERASRHPRRSVASSTLAPSTPSSSAPAGQALAASSSAGSLRSLRGTTRSKRSPPGVNSSNPDKEFNTPAVVPDRSGAAARRFAAPLEIASPPGSHAQTAVFAAPELPPPPPSPPSIRRSARLSAAASELSGSPDFNHHERFKTTRSSRGTFDASLSDTSSFANASFSADGYTESTAPTTPLSIASHPLELSADSSNDKITSENRTRKRSSAGVSESSLKAQRQTRFQTARGAAVEGAASRSTPYNLRSRPSQDNMSAATDHTAVEKNRQVGRKDKPRTSRASASQRDTRSRRSTVSDETDRMDLDHEVHCETGVPVTSANEGSACEAHSSSEKNPRRASDDSSKIDERSIHHQADDIDADEQGAKITGEGSDDVDEDEQDEDEDIEDEDDYADEVSGANPFGLNLRAMAGYMSGLSGRFKTILSSLKNRSDSTAQLAALQELSEVLSISSEDSLAGYFPTESFVTELIRILQGNKDDGAEIGGTEGLDPDQAAVLAALAEDDQEAITSKMLLATRCLANLIEAMPYAAHVIVSHGAVALLNEKLMAIEFIELAEQVMQTLEKLSVDFPSSIVKENGLKAMLQYLDFFNIHTQRTALTAVANCCRKLSSDHFDMVQGSIEQIKDVVGYADRRLKESACKAIVRIIESYKAYPQLLEKLLTQNICQAIKEVLDSASGDPASTGSIGPAMHTDLVKALSTASKASPLIVTRLLELDIATTLYGILTGSETPAAGQSLDATEHGSTAELFDGSSAESSTGGRIKMLQNLSTRPREQVNEVLNLICELLPPLPRTDIFDPRNYSEKALKRKKQEMHKTGDHRTNNTSSVSSPAASEDGDPAAETTLAPLKEKVGSRKSSSSRTTHDSQADRRKLLSEHADWLLSLSTLLLPALVDIHTASATPTVRSKAMMAILKILAFAEADKLESLLKEVPMSTFIAGVLSSSDNGGTVQGSLQIVELLLRKLGHVYRPLLEREGVMWEVKQIAQRPLSTTSSSTEATPSKGGSAPKAAEDPGLSVASNLTTLTPKSKASGSQKSQKDLNNLRAKMLHLCFGRRRSQLSSAEEDGENQLAQATKIAQSLKSSASGSADEARDALTAAIRLFDSKGDGLSGFELTTSGLVDALLAFLNEEPLAIANSERRKIFDATVLQMAEASANLVHRLQESLSRVEKVEIVSVAGSMDDEGRKSPASALSRQVRLRLVAEDPSQVPKSCHNIVVGIHAIAPLRSLHDFLRPKLALGSAGDSPASRLSSVLAAFAAAAGGSSNASGSSSRAAATREIVRDGEEGDRLNDADNGLGEDLGAMTHGNTGDTHKSLAEALVEDLLRESFAAEQEGADDFDVIEREVDCSGTLDAAESTTIASDAPASPSKEDAGKEHSQAHKASKGSYADAVQKSGTDWHITFSMDNRELKLTDTVFGAIYASKRHNDPAFRPDRTFWIMDTTVRYKKVPGPMPKQDESFAMPQTTETAFSGDSLESKLLQLLEAFHRTLTQESELSQKAASSSRATRSWFLNNKLTAKLNRQLEEPMVVASAALPSWALQLPQEYPFLFPFETRFSFLQSTSFGYARLIAQWSGQQRSGDEGRNEDSFGFLGRLQRQKVRISRRHMLDSATKIFDLYASNSSILEIEYFEEVGTGLGPTLEFYSLVSQDFALRENSMWLDDQRNTSALHVDAPLGLFPIPTRADSKDADGRLHKFRTLGTFVAKALLDSRMVQINLSPIFVQRLLGREVPMTLSTLAHVDSGLSSSLKALHDLTADDLAALELDFTLPAEPTFLLKVDGKNSTVDAENFDLYTNGVLDAYLGSGLDAIVSAFRQGFDKVFGLGALKTFTAAELVMLFGNAEEDWSVSALANNIKPDHGYNVQSAPYQDLLSIMTSFSAEERRAFLQWLTGSPKLPIGGFKALNPQLTVVKRPSEAPLQPDDYLPSVSACAHYMKLPAYSTKEVMKKRLYTAVTEGSMSFHLS